MGDEVFCCCTGLNSLTIPEGVSNIGSNAFYYCYNLHSVTIPNGVNNLGSSAFYYCISLFNLTMGNSVRNVRVPLLQLAPEYHDSQQRNEHRRPTSPIPPGHRSGPISSVADSSTSAIPSGPIPLADCTASAGHRRRPLLHAGACWKTDKCALLGPRVVKMATRVCSGFALLSCFGSRISAFGRSSTRTGLRTSPGHTTAEDCPTLT